ncbi:nucleotidyltransferase family protein [Paenibacillus cymbidii]|uniref:nucleotidyltransferase family protein n=1 Tax=Paenibacillus cymbidii TaxID=1639034 RepID=UPI00108180F3|nr:nucleotidyltransferase family protein [Paenibacillus cymbidii]
MDPEASLLLLVLRQFCESETNKDFASEGLAMVNEDKFIRLCNRHKVLPLIASKFVELELTESKTVREGQNQILINAMANLCNMKENKTIIENLEGNGISYVVLKGSYMTLSAYGNVGYRLSQDTDILIDRTDVEKVTDLIQQLGYLRGRFIREEAKVKMYSRQEEIFYSMNTHQAAPFIKTLNHPLIPYHCVDLNLHLTWGEDTQRGDISIADFIGSRRKVSVQGINYFVLPYEEFFIQICLHHFKDVNSIYLLTKTPSLIVSKYCDIYFFLTKNIGAISLPRLYELMGKFQVEMYVHYMLYYTSLIFPSSLITQMLEVLKPKDTGMLKLMGLSSGEKKEWKVDFFERLFASERMGLIKDYLNEQDLMKINYNKEFL